MKFYTFVLNFGYVESASLSFMPWSSNKKFKDAKEALVDLANFFKEQYCTSSECEPKKCCKATSEKDASAEFCSKCGNRLSPMAFSGDNFIDWLRNMSVCDQDGIADFIDWDTKHRWQTGELEGALNQRFVYQAEWVLAAAVGHPHHKEITFEDICKTRTKSRKESFSYF